MTFHNNKVDLYYNNAFRSTSQDYLIIKALFNILKGANFQQFSFSKVTKERFRLQSD
jgi:hypothetical protein